MEIDMKKFTKISLIISAVLAVTGFGFLVAGCVTAGGIGVLRTHLKNGELNFGNWHFEDGVYYSGSKEIDVSEVVKNSVNLLPAGAESVKDEFTENVTRLQMDIDVADVTIKGSDAEYITVRFEDGYVKHYEAKTEGNTLYVTYHADEEHVKNGPAISIELPEACLLEEIHISADVGTVKLKEIRNPLQTVDINAALGDVTIKECTVQGDCTVTAALGDIKIKESEFTNVKLTANLGNADFEGTIKSELYIKADMGNIKAELDGRASDYNITLSTDMGNVKYNGEMQGEAGGTFSYNQKNAEKNITLDCGMGNVEVEFDMP